MTLLDQSVFKELEDMVHGLREIATQLGLNPDCNWRDLVTYIQNDIRVLKLEHTALLYGDWSEWDEEYVPDDEYGDDAYDEGLDYLFGSME